MDLASVVRAVAVITGRPARKALALGGLDEVGQQIGDTGRELFVFGQYGYERWSSTQRRGGSPPPPPGTSGLPCARPPWCPAAGRRDAIISAKTRSITAH